MKHRLTVAVALALASTGAHAVTKYVRTDGGTASQCTGNADAAYDGSGTGEACAYNSPATGFGALSGGDTLIIGNGSYSITAALIPPSGTATAPTRVLGEQSGNCRIKPELWGTAGRSRIIDLSGRSWVEVACLEITDHDDCINGHYSLDCTTGDLYAIDGVYAYDSANLTLRDLNVHGLVNGFRGGKVNNLTMERVRLVANGDAGFHGATGRASPGDSFTGTIRLKNVEIAWNGCGEQYPTLKIHGCYSEIGEGYGDGLGTADTSGVWIIEDSHVHHNTSDGLDLRYTKLAGADVQIRRSWFYGNAGNQVKTWGKTLIENSYINSNCGYFGTRYGQAVNPDTGALATTPETCRADGNAVIVIPNSTSGTQATLRYNTIAGESAALVQFASGGSATSSVIARLENNVLVGGTVFTGSGLPKLVSNGASISVQYASNTIHNTSSACPSGSTCANPMLRSITIGSFDPRPAAGSIVLGAANATLTTPTTDITGKARPTSPARGAFEYSP